MFFASCVVLGSIAAIGVAMRIIGWATHKVTSAIGYRTTPVVASSTNYAFFYNFSVGVTEGLCTGIANKLFRVGGYKPTGWSKWTTVPLYSCLFALDCLFDGVMLATSPWYFGTIQLASYGYRGWFFGQVTQLAEMAGWRVA